MNGKSSWRGETAERGPGSCPAITHIGITVAQAQLRAMYNSLFSVPTDFVFKAPQAHSDTRSATVYLQHPIEHVVELGTDRLV